MDLPQQVENVTTVAGRYGQKAEDKEAKKVEVALSCECKDKDNFYKNQRPFVIYLLLLGYGSGG